MTEVVKDQIWKIPRSGETLLVRFVRNGRVWCWQLDGQGYQCGNTTLPVESLLNIGELHEICDR